MLFVVRLIPVGFEAVWVVETRIVGCNVRRAKWARVSCKLFFDVMPVEFVMDWVVIVEDAEVGGGAIGAPWGCVCARTSHM